MNGATRPETRYLNGGERMRSAVRTTISSRGSAGMNSRFSSGNVGNPMEVRGLAQRLVGRSI